MTKVRTFKKEKWLFFVLSIIVYFVPFIIVTACLFPMMRKADAGYRWALGIVIVLVNALPFFMGVFRSLLAHFPMVNTIAIAITVLGVLFNFDIIAEYIDKFLWIEATAAVCSVISCILWGFHKKYVRYSQSVKAVKLSGMV